MKTNEIKAEIKTVATLSMSAIDTWVDSTYVALQATEATMIEKAAILASMGEEARDVAIVRLRERFADSDTWNRKASLLRTYLKEHNLNIESRRLGKAEAEKLGRSFNPAIRPLKETAPKETAPSTERGKAEAEAAAPLSIEAVLLFIKTANAAQLRRISAGVSSRRKELEKAAQAK